MLPITSGTSWGTKIYLRRSTISEDAVFLTQLESLKMKNTVSTIAGIYYHHYPICIRKILSDDTFISMASPSKGIKLTMVGESISAE